MSQAMSQNEIDALLSSIGGAPADTSGPKPSNTVSSSNNMEMYSKPENDVKNYKLYNFRRPDKFSKDHLKALQTIHDTFAHQLALIISGYLRMGIEIDVVSVDQLTYDEFVRSMPSPITVVILEMPPLVGQGLLGFSHEITSSYINRMLGGPGTSEVKPRELTDIERSLMRRVIDKSVTCLEEAWQSFVPAKASVIGIEEGYGMIQVASPGEIVALITLEVKIGPKDSGLMSLCLPFPILENVLPHLSAQHIFHRHNEGNTEQEKEQILTRINYAKMPVEVFLAGTQVTVQELMDLNTGDVIKLDRLVSQDLLVNVNHRPKFYARPGRIKDKLAVCITDIVENIETIEGFGLHGSI
jgi:flagellar motor switch protein FliM